MFLIMVYDINEKRVFKVLKTARRYLNWVQNSVLEGEINEAGFERLKVALGKIIKEEEDSITFYSFRTTKYMQKYTMGKIKAEPDEIII